MTTNTPRSVRLPDDLEELTEHYLQQNYMTFSVFVRQAVAEKLKREHQPITVDKGTKII